MPPLRSTETAVYDGLKYAGGQPRPVNPGDCRLSRDRQDELLDANEIRLALWVVPMLEAHCLGDRIEQVDISRIRLTD